LRQLAVELGIERLAVNVDQRALVPARERLVLGDRDFQSVGPEPAQRHALHPRHACKRCARVGEAHREKCPAQLFANHGTDMRGVDAHQRPVDSHVPDCKDRLTSGPRDPTPREQR